MSDPIPGNPDRFKLGQGADPPELKLLLLPLGDDSSLREAMTRAFYGIMEGAPNSINVQHAVLLSGLVHAYKTAVDLQAQSAAKLNGTNGAASPGGIPRGKTLKAVLALQVSLEELRKDVSGLTNQSNRTAPADQKLVEAVAERTVQTLEPRMRAYMSDLVTRSKVVPRRFFWWALSEAAALLFFLGIVVHAWWVGRSDSFAKVQQSSAILRQDQRSKGVNHLNPSDLSGGYSYSADPALKQAYRALDKYNQLYPRTDSSPSD